MKIPKVKKNKTIKEKKPRKKKSKKNIILIFLISMGIICASAVLAFALYIIVTSPDFVPNELYTKEPTVIYAKDGTTELARLGKKNVELVTYQDMPQVLIDALVATEDSRFFQHNGVDAARFIKASIGQLAGKNAGGASTLSMQVIKNTYTKKTKDENRIESFLRKFKDIYMAVFKLESAYTKEEIIEFYLNSQWLGSGYGTYETINGVEQGSQYFFGKSVSDLTLPEASLLVGLFNNPVAFDPYKYPEKASNRRSVVLNLMVRHGYITEEEKEFAESVSVESLLTEHSLNDTGSEYRAFIDFLLYQVQEETGDNPYDVPMAIYTTLDVEQQKVIRKLEKGESYKFRDDTVQFGLAVTDLKDGSITALSGGRNYAPTGKNRGVPLLQTKLFEGIRRSPGSTAKPIFDYGPHIEYLHSSPGTIFIDQPWTYSNGTAFQNYDRGYKGAITMRYALQDSRNVPAVQAFQQVVDEVGIDKIADFVHSLGVDYGSTLHESAAIGGVDCADPLTMSAAYATFGRGGYYIEPYSFTKVVYLETEDVHTHKVAREKVMSEQTAYLITDMLVSVTTSGGAGNIGVSGTQIAAKTGTSTYDSKQAAANGLNKPQPDHWLITYSPDYSIALWCGYDTLGKGKPYLQSASGNSMKKTMMGILTRGIYKKNSKFDRPSGLSSVTVEKETYPVMLASANTPENMRLADIYISGYEPSEVSPRFDTLSNPSNGKYSYSGGAISLTWDAISTPDMINTSYLESYFNKADYWKTYERYKEKYYNEYVNYNNANIGTVGYQVYLKDTNGELISLGYTNNTNFSYTPTGTNTNYTFVIKSTYSIFKNNMSSGLEINANITLDTNIGDNGGPTEVPDNPDLPNNPLE